MLSPGNGTSKFSFLTKNFGEVPPVVPELSDPRQQFLKSLNGAIEKVIKASENPGVSLVVRPKNLPSAGTKQSTDLAGYTQALRRPKYSSPPPSSTALKVAPLKARARVVSEPKGYLGASKLPVKREAGAQGGALIKKPSGDYTPTKYQIKPKTMTLYQKPGEVGSKEAAKEATKESPSEQRPSKPIYTESGPGSGRLAAIAGAMGREAGGSHTGGTVPVTQGVPGAFETALGSGRQKIQVGSEAIPETKKEKAQREKAEKDKTEESKKSMPDARSTIRAPGMMKSRPQPKNEPDQSRILLYISNK